MRRILLAVAVASTALIARPAVAHATCGDGVLDGADVCDDGNTRDGDGCSATCTVDAGTTCQTLAALAVQNPSFESPLGASDWELVSGGVDRVDGAADGGCMPAGDGGFSIDLIGVGQGVIAQTFATVPGRRYGVLFLASANCIEISGQPCNLTCTARLVVGAAVDTAATTAVDITSPISNAELHGAGSPQLGWVPRRFDFVAESASTVLYFSGAETAGEAPMIDDVQIAESWCLPTTCGNGALDAPEVCDDSNAVGGDGCSGDCAVVEDGYTCPVVAAPCGAACGDGRKQNAEGCDDGAQVPDDGCSFLCTVELGWTCTVTPPAVISVCDYTCGDSEVTGNEPCDDGNTDVDDGCTAACSVEPGWTCTVTPPAVISVCNFTCGDGVFDGPEDGGNESCEDGNNSNGDGCSMSCQGEDGWTCRIDLGTCEPRCFDGRIVGDEECDDDNFTSDDGCNACIVEPGWECDGAPSLCTPPSGGGSCAATVPDESSRASVLAMVGLVLFHLFLRRRRLR